MHHTVWIIKQYTDEGTTTVGYCLTREDALAWIDANKDVAKLCKEPLHYYLEEDKIPPIAGPPKLYRVMLSCVPPTVNMNEVGDVTGAIVVGKDCIEYNTSLLGKPRVYPDGDRFISIGYSVCSYYSAMYMAMKTAKYDHHKCGYPEDSFPEDED